MTSEGRERESLSPDEIGELQASFEGFSLLYQLIVDRKGENIGGSYRFVGDVGTFSLKKTQEEVKRKREREGEKGEGEGDGEGEREKKEGEKEEL